MATLYTLHHKPRAIGPDFNEASTIVKQMPGVHYHDGKLRNNGEALIVVATDDKGGEELAKALPGWKVGKTSVNLP